MVKTNIQMKKRILITMHYMEIGGAESALLGLLMAIDYSRYAVDLFLYAHRGELLPLIPKEVNLMPEVKVYSLIESPLLEAVKRGCIRLAARRLLAKWLCRRYRKRVPALGDDGAIMQYVGDCVTPILPSIAPEVEYDLAISFLTPHNVVRDKVLAKKKLAWIHTDYSKVSINAEKELPVWGAFDNIASISADVRKSFVKTFPTLENKIVDIENILSAEFVRRRAEEFDAKSELSQQQGGGNHLNNRTLRLSKESG